MAQAKVLAGPASTFDAQASHYDARVGLPESVSAAVELGAGIDEIGVPLALSPVRYIGLDSSPAMLDLF
jgi:hypothetical protein